MEYNVTAICLNWNCLEVSKDTVRLLLHEGHEVILIDNGSTDGSKEFFRDVMDDNFKLIDFPENVGISKGRNAGIDLATGKDIFLIDGDILYVKGTIKEYQKVLDFYPDAFCVGQNSMELLHRTGHNGVLDPTEADFRMGTDYEIKEGFPMAWTNYGLFRGDLLRKVKFYEEGVYGEPGYGFEDTWLWHELTELGFVSLSISLPVFYHHAHNTWRQFNKTDQSDKMRERREAFDAKWGKNKDWGDLLKKNSNFTTRLNP